MAAIARWCMRHRLLAVLIWLLALGGTAAAAGTVGAAFSNDYEVPGTESGKANDLLREGFHGQGGDTDTIVWRAPERQSARTPGVEQRMTRALDAVAALPGVGSVAGPYGPGPDSAARISPDGRTAYAVVTFDRPADSVPKAQAQAVLDAAKNPATETDGLQVELGGRAIGLTEAPSAHLAEVIGVAIAALVLFLAFGSLAASLLPIATALVSVGTAYFCITLLGHAMPVADFAPMLGTLVGLGVGIDYALFIVTRHRKGLARGLPVEEAAENAVATTGRAVVFAGATVCIALLGMLVLRLNFLNGVAIAASVTVVLTVAASVTLLPALLSYIGMRALSRRERRKLAAEGPRPEHTTGFAARWSAFVERHPKLLGVIATGVMLVLALPTLFLHLGTSDQGNNPATSTTRQAYDLLAEGFGPGTNGPLTVVARLDGAGDRVAVEQLAEALRTTKGVASTGLAVLNRSGDTAVLTVVPDSAPQSRATSDLVDTLREDVIPRAGHGNSMEIHVGGVTAGYDDFAEVIIGKLPLFVGVVIALGCVLLLLAFRSIGIPVKAAAMNVAAVASSFGVVVAIFQWGWGSELLGLGSAGPIEPFLPVIMVSVLFGLSMDYQVFLVSRMYEEWLETGDNQRAVRVGLAETSRVINSAAVIMISVFLAFVFSGDRIIAMFGIALAAAVALDAFVLRTLLVPALMHMLGGANWWLPAWLDRRLPRISIEPPDRGPHAKLPAQRPSEDTAEPADSVPVSR
ncbi:MULTISPECIES: MMPL family transporter [unclassified Streptomyces]|uniref:MMPL family transporter n=1 Tax=unclassified Streptomyces TaxID=2593676 RepID=UPI00224DA92E|nr:MMPL family transporter [Streptomyces sp. NBC_00047]MCX5612047.1 MMPL family transporter [Streptomyces sp. NBC_00047]